MDINNPGTLVLLVARIVIVLAIAIFVIPVTIRELRRKQYSRPLYILRWGLFILSILYVLPAIFPIWNGFDRLDSEPSSTLSTVAAYWQGVREVSMGAMVVLVYYVAKLISRSEK